MFVQLRLIGGFPSWLVPRLAIAVIIPSNCHNAELSSMFAFMFTVLDKRNICTEPTGISYFLVHLLDLLQGCQNHLMVHIDPETEVHEHLC